MAYRLTTRCVGCQSVRMFSVDASGRGRCLACGHMAVVGPPAQDHRVTRRRLW